MSTMQTARSDIRPGRISVILAALGTILIATLMASAPPSAAADFGATPPKSWDGPYIIHSVKNRHCLKADGGVREPTVSNKGIAFVHDLCSYGRDYGYYDRWHFGQVEDGVQIRNSAVGGTDPKKQLCLGVYTRSDGETAAHWWPCLNWNDVVNRSQVWHKEARWWRGGFLLKNKAKGGCLSVATWRTFEQPILRDCDRSDNGHAWGQLVPWYAAPWQ